MKRHLLSLAILWLVGLVSAASNEFIDLHPLPRHVWDMDHLSKRDDAVQSVGLQDHEKFMWASGQGTLSSCYIRDWSNSRI